MLTRTPVTRPRTDDVAPMVPWRLQRCNIGKARMDFDPQMAELGVRLGEATVRNAASVVVDRIGKTKAKRRDQDTINELEEIVNSLLADKSELIQIARAYEQEFVAQTISQADIEYITTRLIPILKEFLEQSATGQGQSLQQVQEMIDLLTPILSIETITILQLAGFNFKRAIGEPLTMLVSRLITSRVQTDQEIQRLAAQKEIAYLQVAGDEDAYNRLMRILGREQ